jgi:hypothetical protein
MSGEQKPFWNGLFKSSDMLTPLPNICITRCQMMLTGRPSMTPPADLIFKWIFSIMSHLKESKLSLNFLRIFVQKLARISKNYVKDINAQKVAKKSVTKTPLLIE